jgi:hypothetical protein
VAPLTAFQEIVTCALPAVAETPVGVPGAATGVAPTWADSALSRLAFAAVTT